MKLALFGGSFDPVHHGHTKLVEKIDELFSFDKVFIIPSKRPPHKTPFVASDSQRMEMLKIAFSDSKISSKTEISDFELKSDQISYSIFTINHFTKKYPNDEIYFLIGDDAFYGIPDWYQFPKVLESCHFLVCTRKGVEGKREAIIDELVSEELMTQIDTKIFLTKNKKTVQFLEVSVPEISSTELRLSLQMGLDPNLNKISQKVAEYLKNNKVYQLK